MGTWQELCPAQQVWLITEDPWWFSERLLVHPSGTPSLVLIQQQQQQQQHKAQRGPAARCRRHS